MECEEVTHSDTTLEEQLDQLAEYYISLGVPYEVFWYDDYCKLKYYEAAYRNKRKMENENMWLQGMYFYQAIAIALSNAFRGKGKQPQNYPDKPMDIFPKTEAEQKAENERIKQRIINNLNALKRAWDNKNVSRNSETRD